MSSRIREGHIHISWESDINDSSMLAESLANSVLINIEGQVTQEESVGRRVGGVAKGCSTTLGTLSGRIIGAGSGEVDVGLATVDQSAFLGLESSSSGSRAGELNISETPGAATLAVTDDTGARDLSELLKLTHEPLIIDIPAQITDKQVLGTGILSSLGLCLLGRGGDLVVSLALLGGGNLILALGVAGVRARAGIRARSFSLVLIGIRRVGRLGRFILRIGRFLQQISKWTLDDVCEIDLQ